MNADLLTAEDVRELLWRATRQSRNQKLWAAEHDLSPAYLSDVIHGRREPGEKILQALRLERKTVYTKRD